MAPVAISPVQAVDRGAIDAFVNAERERQHIPGIAVAVVRNGKPLYVKGFGKASLKPERAVTPETVFNIGSVSKQFLATAVMKLQEQGKLRLDDSLDQHFPDAPAAWRGITVRHLLSHTSGLPRELTGWNPLSAYGEADWLRLAYATRPVAEPGTQWEYSNAGYFILALLISRASGRPWGEYVESEIFRASGMGSTRVALPSLVVPHRADGYVWDGQRWKDDGPLNSVRPSGAFVSTLSDLVRWEQVLTERKLLKPASFEAMAQASRTTDGRDRAYGLGWYLDAYGPHRVVHHAGGIVGYRAEFMRFVDKGLTVILLTNIGTLQTEVIAQGIARRALPELMLTRGKPGRDGRPKETSEVREVLVRVADGADVGEGLATPELRKAVAGYPAAQREDLKGALVFLREFDVRKFVVSRQGKRIARTRIYRIGADRFLTAYFTAEEKLAFFEVSGDQP